uniref:Uncharacterized protein n=1 Tax=viral metagenome TaxID=1070528 RepID=A0A6C0DST8_9ZZZZ
MADDIKRVVYDVPAVPVRNTRRRTRQGPASKPKPVAVPKIPVAQAAGAAVGTASAVPRPMLSTTTAVGGSKKRDPVAAIVAAGPTKKPIVKVALPYNNSPAAAVATPPKPKTAPPAVKIVHKPVQTRRVEPVNKVKINPEKRKNTTLKRKFSEKKVVVKIESASKVRKTRDAIRRKVANMKIEEVSEKLRARGLTRPNAKVPEEMQRNMLIDVMMFPVHV